MRTRTVLRTPAELAEAGLIAREQSGQLQVVADRYAVAVTDHLADLIDRADLADPIARQFIPSAMELDVQPEERGDPIGDDSHSPVEGLVHRYPDRVLLKLVHVCAVYCRFCFRREMVGPGKRRALTPAQFRAAREYIAAHPEIWEVILTGGDPLVLSPRRLREALCAIAAIPHVKVLRLHTRIPVVDPSRIDRAMIGALRSTGKAVYVALHANHPREFTEGSRAACSRLVDAGIPMISQTVLLRGVNDNVATLTALMRAFVECRVKPYYLHHADLAPGTAHLRTTIAEGQALIHALRGHVSGLCVPEYMLDIPGGHGKVRLEANSAEGGEQTTYVVKNFRGDQHRYEDTAVRRQASHKK
jgi:lysine 2,3-aminomutase